MDNNSNIILVFILTIVFLITREIITKVATREFLEANPETIDDMENTQEEEE